MDGLLNDQMHNKNILLLNYNGSRDYSISIVIKDKPPLLNDDDDDEINLKKK